MIVYCGLDSWGDSFGCCALISYVALWLPGISGHVLWVTLNDVNELNINVSEQCLRMLLQLIWTLVIRAITQIADVVANDFLFTAIFIRNIFYFISIFWRYRCIQNSPHCLIHVLKISISCHMASVVITVYCSKDINMEIDQVKWIGCQDILFVHLYIHINWLYFIWHNYTQIVDNEIEQPWLICCCGGNNINIFVVVQALDQSTKLDIHCDKECHLQWYSFCSCNIWFITINCI